MNQFLTWKTCPNCGGKLSPWNDHEAWCWACEVTIHTPRPDGYDRSGGYGRLRIPSQFR